MFYNLLSCVVLLSQMLTAIFQPAEIHNFHQVTVRFMWLPVMASGPLLARVSVVVVCEK